MSSAVLQLPNFAITVLLRLSASVASILGWLGLSALLATPVLANPMASDWSQGFHSKVRLTAATLLGDGDGTALYAGVDIRMDKNWKTYWKAPGDGGGIPPEFNWSRSQNVKAARVMYPLPKLMKDIDGYSLGYKDAVLFPVSVTPANPALPVKLRLDVYYGVCEEICIPAEASLQLDIMPNARATLDVQRGIMAALSEVPVTSPNGLSIAQRKLKLDGNSPHALVTVKAPGAREPIKLFAVSRKGDYLPIPKMVGRTDDGVSTFKIDFSHVEKPTNLPGQTFELTVSADGRGSTFPWTMTAP